MVHELSTGPNLQSKFIHCEDYEHFHRIQQNEAQ
jgi:hypothetical protein